MAKQSILQKILRWFYPLIKKLGKKGKNGMVKQLPLKDSDTFPSADSLKINLNTGDTVELDSLKGKKVVLVNTASNCGYTGQYEELQKLQNIAGDKLAIIGFPANDFANQEKGNDESISQFCQINYGVSFPLAKKSQVIKGKDQNEVFKWLSKASNNGWNDQEPVWNFSKYVLNEKGQLTHFFGPSVSPLDQEFIEDALGFSQNQLD